MFMNSFINLSLSPQDEELREDIKKILEGANLEVVTMKSVCKKVHLWFNISYCIHVS